MLRNYIPIFVALLVWSFSLAQTLGGTLIPNQAVATYRFAGQDQTPETSNIVRTNVPSVCGLDLTPNGSVATPAQQQSGFVETVFYLPYSLNNTGNGPQDYMLTTTLESASTLTPVEINIILDSNNNQIADAGESIITELADIGYGASVSLLVEVITGSDLADVGQIFVNLIGSCSDGSAIDDDNISQITVLEGGIQSLTKSSVPASGSFVVAGDTITYTVSFEVNEQPLSNVVISDVMDANLNAPTTLVIRVNDGVRAGAVDYDAVTRTVSTTIASLEPNDSVELTIITTVGDDVLGGTVISNQATVGFDGAPTQETNEVVHNTTSVCGLVITPDGAETLPAHQETALPGQVVVFPYTLANVGNITATYDLSLQTLTQSDFISRDMNIVLDTNENGLVDTGEAEITSHTLAPDTSAELLVIVAMPAGADVTGDSLINIIGVCRDDTSARDDNNISQATIPLGGFATPEKSADPASGIRLYPGVALSYSITFTANGRDLRNVVVSDVLSEFLEAPESFTTGTVTDPITGQGAAVIGNYDTTSRKLTWTLPSVPAGMTVNLEIVTAVRADLTIIPANTVIENVASVKSEDSSETLTNTTTHPLAPIAILLRKTANSERVSIGETLFYTLEIINPDDSLDLQTLELTDDLPDVLRYQPNTSVVTLPDGTEQKLEPTVKGQQLTWMLPPLKAGERISVLFATTVLPGAELVEEIVNTAQVVASDVNGRAVADAAATVGTVIQEGALDAKAVLLGTVFVDYNLNGFYDQGVDKPAENVRLYLSDGHATLSDASGRYTFLELGAGIESLKVDTTTLPARLFEKTKDEIKAGLWRVRLEAGLITRQDVPLLPPQALLDVGQHLNVTMGSVTIHKSVIATSDAVQVILQISSSQALKDLSITDHLTDSAQLAGQVIHNADIQAEGLQFTLGDIPAGYETEIRYLINITGDVRDVLIAPDISWDVRP